MKRFHYFAGHYTIWQEKRVTAVVEHFTPQWFGGKKLLELGCGYGDIGQYFTIMGADVTFSDARDEHLDHIRSLGRGHKTVLANLEREWPFEGRFDLIIHFGVLYHLNDYAFSLRKAMASADYMVLETIVADAEGEDEVYYVEEDAKGFDTAFEGRAARFSAANLEKIMREAGARFERVTDRRLNSTIHQYDWHVTGRKIGTGGLRRFWFVDCRGCPHP